MSAHTTVLPSIAPVPRPNWANSARDRRRRRGRTANFAGLAAEESVARRYAAAGGEILCRRHRTSSGELDLVVRLDGILVFVEVKCRKSRKVQDSPVTENQWQRLACAAQEFMLENYDMTRQPPLCRFDVAIVGPDGSADIVENARMFD